MDISRDEISNLLTSVIFGEHNVAQPCKNLMI